ncbi:MAG: sensor histidine kinase [Planctomycetota bacterium]|jgi:two-component system phosphate regulon sensor histidine kinase PhoR
MPARHRASLWWQVGAAIIVLHAAVLLALGGYAFAEVARFHHEQARAELERLVLHLSERYADAIRDQVGAARLQAMVVADARIHPGAHITLIESDGAVLANSQGLTAEASNQQSRPEVAAALAGGIGSSERSSSSRSARTMFLARAIPGPGDAPMVIRVSLPLASVDNQLASLRRALIVAGVLSLLLTSTVVYFISRRVSTTVGTIADGAARFADGDLAHRVSEPSSRELARLATALNDMAQQLDEQIVQLQRQGSEQQAILQSMSNGVIALDLQQRILSMNQAAEEILSVDSSTARGRLLQAVVREPPLNRFVEHALGDPDEHTDEFALESDTARRIQVISEPLHRSRDEHSGLLLVLNDVTDLRRLESLRSDFASNVSHELRTPITNIKGYVETLLDGGLDEPGQAERFLRVIKENGDRLAAIIDDILALTRLEEPQARVRLERESTALHTLIQGGARQFATAAAAKDIAIECRVPSDLVASVHPQLLEQAIGNLLSNAINYSPPGTTVAIKGRAADEDQLEIEIIDEGPGIAAEHLPRLFERFYRVDRARSRELGGTGLGLAIVKHVALVHGGRVEVESEVGRGSVFRLVLPLV